MGAAGRRPLAAVLVATLVLVLGAAGAGYAALSKKSRKAPVVIATVPAPAATTATPPAAATTPGVTVPAAPSTKLSKPPKIPLKAATPAPAATIPATTTPSTPAPAPTRTSEQSAKSNTGGSGETGKAPEPTALILDTDAAGTYNPYSYPATWFGDPTLTIDGDPTTAWTAQVDPATLPNLAEGLLIDLKSARKLASVSLITSTPGITVQVYGSKSTTVPASITDPAWVPLSRSIVVEKRHAKIKLRQRGSAYRYVTLWISKAPESLAGTPEAPGKVSIDELELFPAS